MLTDVGRDGDEASCYAEPYSEADAQRVIEYITERREDGVSVNATAKHTGLDEDVVGQIVADLIHQRPPKLRRVYKGSVWLIFPPLESYDKSISEVVSEEQDKTEPEHEVETATRIKCFVKGCDSMMTKNRTSMGSHLKRVHLLPLGVVEDALDSFFRDGKIPILENPPRTSFKCPHCPREFRHEVYLLKHEPTCHKNPDRDKNVYEARKKKYGENAVYGELTNEKLDKLKHNCPLCDGKYTGKRGYENLITHLRDKHSDKVSSRKEAKDLIALTSKPCTDEQCVIGAEIAEHIKAGPESIKVQQCPPANTMGAVLEHVLEPNTGRKPREVPATAKLRVHIRAASDAAEEMGFRLDWSLRPR